MTETEEEYLNQGKLIAQGMINQQLLPLLGENPDRWFGAGVMASWLGEAMKVPDDDDDNDYAIKLVLLVSLLVRGVLEHPLAVGALDRWANER